MHKWTALLNQDLNKILSNSTVDFFFFFFFFFFLCPSQPKARLKFQQTSFPIEIFGHRGSTANIPF